MDADLFELMFDQIGYMTNQELLRGLTSSCYPNMKKESARKTHKTTMKHAYPSMFTKHQAIKADDIKMV